MTRLVRNIFIVLVGFYKAHLSPQLVGQCAYHPSCSKYAMDALQNAPLHKALFAILMRILRCHPFAKGGWDPFVKSKNGDSCCE